MKRSNLPDPAVVELYVAVLFAMLTSALFICFAIGMGRIFGV